MTTQLPHGSYPTAPPWAPPPPEPPPPYRPYGGLMVPFPEEMINAARPEPPSWVPVVLFTFFFGLFGAVSAGRRAARARLTRNERHPYWIAFGVTLGVSLVLQAVLVAGIWSERCDGAAGGIPASVCAIG
nr:hypothetical protein [uncultured Actinoplanes sp.]